MRNIEQFLNFVKIVWIKSSTRESFGVNLSGGEIFRTRYEYVYIDRFCLFLRWITVFISKTCKNPPGLITGDLFGSPFTNTVQPFFLVCVEKGVRTNGISPTFLYYDLRQPILLFKGLGPVSQRVTTNLHFDFYGILPLKSIVRSILTLVKQGPTGLICGYNAVTLECCILCKSGSWFLLYHCNNI